MSTAEQREERWMETYRVQSAALERLTARVRELEAAARAMWPDNPLIRAAEPWLRPFSTDTAAAMTLLDTLAARGWSWTITHDPLPGALDTYEGYVVVLTRIGPDQEYISPEPGYGRTLPLAACAAVLAALDREEPADGC